MRKDNVTYITRRNQMGFYYKSLQIVKYLTHNPSFLTYSFVFNLKIITLKGKKLMTCTVNYISLWLSRDRVSRTQSGARAFLYVYSISPCSHFGWVDIRRPFGRLDDIRASLWKVFITLCASSLEISMTGLDVL